MHQTVENSNNTLNLNNFDRREERTLSTEFLNRKVDSTPPINSVQQQFVSYNTPQAKVADRSWSLTSDNSLNTSTIRSFDTFSNKNDMLDYFLERITLIYTQNNVAINPRFTRYITERKEKDFNSPIKYKELYDFFTNFSNFIDVYLTRNYNEIIDIMDTVFYTSGKKRQRPIQSSLIKNFIALTDKQTRELAGNKDLYKCLLVIPDLASIDFNNIESITKESIKNNKKQEKKICTFIDSSSADESIKYLIREHATNIFAICHRKNIDIDNNLQLMIKYLLKSEQLTNADTDAILTKIKFFFDCFNDYNEIIDTSILTDIICYNKETTNEQLLLSICNITDQQIQFITSCKSRWKIIQPWTFKGFPEAENIERKINQLKKNNTTNSSTDISVDCSELQPDIIDLTKTTDTPSTAINSKDAVIVSDIEQSDDIEESDLCADWLDDIPNFLAEFNSHTTSKSQLIWPTTTKRSLDIAELEQENNQNKKTKYS